MTTIVNNHQDTDNDDISKSIPRILDNVDKKLNFTISNEGDYVDNVFREIDQNTVLRRVFGRSNHSYGSNHKKSFTDNDILYQGYLHKRGSWVKSWKKRYFILRKDIRSLCYFESRDNLKLLGSIPLCVNTYILPVSPEKADHFKHVLEILPDGVRDSSKSTIFIRADSQDDIKRWESELINEATNTNEMKSDSFDWWKLIFNKIPEVSRVEKSRVQPSSSQVTDNAFQFTTKHDNNNKNINNNDDYEYNKRNEPLKLKLNEDLEALDSDDLHDLSVSNDDHENKVNTNKRSSGRVHSLRIGEKIVEVVPQDDDDENDNDSDEDDQKEPVSNNNKPTSFLPSFLSSSSRQVVLQKILNAKSFTSSLPVLLQHRIENQIQSIKNIGTVLKAGSKTYMSLSQRNNDPEKPRKPPPFAEPDVNRFENPETGAISGIQLSIELSNICNHLDRIFAVVFISNHDVNSYPSNISRDTINLNQTDGKHNLRATCVENDQNMKFDANKHGSNWKQVTITETYTVNDKPAHGANVIDTIIVHFTLLIEPLFTLIEQSYHNPQTSKHKPEIMIEVYRYENMTAINNPITNPITSVISSTIDKPITLVSKIISPFTGRNKKSNPNTVVNTDINKENADLVSNQSSKASNKQIEDTSDMSNNTVSKFALQSKYQTISRIVLDVDSFNCHNMFYAHMKVLIEPVVTGLSGSNKHTIIGGSYTSLRSQSSSPQATLGIIKLSSTTLSKHRHAMTEALAVKPYAEMLYSFQTTSGQTLSLEQLYASPYAVSTVDAMVRFVHLDRGSCLVALRKAVKQEMERLKEDIKVLAGKLSEFSANANAGDNAVSVLSGVNSSGAAANQQHDNASVAVSGSDDGNGLVDEAVVQTTDESAASDHSGPQLGVISPSVVSLANNVEALIPNLINTVVDNNSNTGSVEDCQNQEIVTMYLLLQEQYDVLQNAFDLIDKTQDQLQEDFTMTLETCRCSQQYGQDSDDVEVDSDNLSSKPIFLNTIKRHTPFSMNESKTGNGNSSFKSQPNRFNSISEVINENEEDEVDDADTTDNVDNNLQTLNGLSDVSTLVSNDAKGSNRKVNSSVYSPMASNSSSSTLSFNNFGHSSFTNKSNSTRNKKDLNYHPNTFIPIQHGGLLLRRSAWKKHSQWQFMTTNLNIHLMTSRHFNYTDLLDDHSKQIDRKNSSNAINSASNIVDVDIPVDTHRLVRQSSILRIKSEDQNNNIARSSITPDEVYSFSDAPVKSIPGFTSSQSSSSNKFLLHRQISANVATMGLMGDKGKIHVMPYFTLGVPAAHCLKFKEGGLRRILDGLSSACVSMDNTAKIPFPTAAVPPKASSSLPTKSRPMSMNFGLAGSVGLLNDYNDHTPFLTPLETSYGRDTMELFGYRLNEDGRDETLLKWLHFIQSDVPVDKLVLLLQQYPQEAAVLFKDIVNSFASTGTALNHVAAGNTAYNSSAGGLSPIGISSIVSGIHSIIPNYPITAPRSISSNNILIDNRNKDDEHRKSQVFKSNSRTAVSIDTSKSIYDDLGRSTLSSTPGGSGRVMNSTPHSPTSVDLSQYDKYQDLVLKTTLVKRKLDLGHRLNICCSQVLAFALTQVKTILICSTQDHDCISGGVYVETLQRSLKIGFLLGLQSFLSTFGDELGMLEDAEIAVQWLSLVTLRLVSYEKNKQSRVNNLSAPVFGGNNVSMRRDKSGRLIVDLEVYDAEIEVIEESLEFMHGYCPPYESSCNPIERSVSKSRVRGKSSETNVLEDLTGYATVFNPHPDVSYLPHELVPTVHAVTQLHAVLFTQGINELQTFANLSQSKDVLRQVEINQLALCQLSAYFDMFISALKFQLSKICANLALPTGAPKHIDSFRSDSFIHSQSDKSSDSSEVNSRSSDVSYSISYGRPSEAVSGSLQSSENSRGSFLASIKANINSISFNKMSNQAVGSAKVSSPQSILTADQIQSKIVQSYCRSYEAAKDAVLASAASPNDKHVDVLLKLSSFCRKISSSVGILCKSGKDRTGMSVTLEISRSLVEDLGVLGGSEVCKVLRTYGVRRMNLYANTGQSKFAFNQIQKQMLPSCYKPPPGTHAGNIAS